MSQHAPEIVDPVAFADKGRIVEGGVPLAVFGRLRDQLFATAGEARFHLRFAREGRIACARGWVESAVWLQCQACLGAVRYDIARDVALGFVASIAEADLLPEPFEPVILDDPHAACVADLVEDEILLAIPDVPRHGACDAIGPEQHRQTVAQAEGRRPFAALDALLTTTLKQNSDRS